MVNFWKQLNLLLWKNFAIRKRQVFRNCVEILWPLAIFIILVAVRKRRPPENVPEKKQPIYFAPRALPSAGALPFVQSIFCNYKVNEFLTEPQELPSFTNSAFSKFLVDLNPILTNQTIMDMFQNISSDLQFLNNQEIFQQLNVSEIPVSDLFGGEDTAKKLLKSVGLNDSVVVSLSQTKVRLSGVISIWENMELANLSTWYHNGSLRVNSTLQEFKHRLCEKDMISKVLDFPSEVDIPEVKQELCNLSISKLRDLGSHLYDHRVELFSEIENITRIEKFFTIFKEIVALQSELQDIRNIANDLIQFVRSNDPTSDVRRNFNLKDFICGQNKSVSTTPKPATTPEENTTEEKTTTTPSGTTGTTPATKVTPTRKTTTHGGKDETCNYSNPAKRVDCGWGGISKKQCKSRGCCYDESIKHAKYCFCRQTVNGSNCCVARNRLMQIISSGSGGSSQMSNFFALALEGKIFYAPNNTKTNEVIGKMSSFLTTFSSALKSGGTLKNVIKDVLDITETFVRDKKQLQRVEVVLDMILSLNIFSNVSKELNEVLNFLRVNKKYLNSITEEQIQMVKNYANIFLPIFDELEYVSKCYDLSTFFVPFESELHLEARAINMTTGTFLSGIVFNNLHDDSKPFPKKINYTLRFNPDYTPSTARKKARYWRPGPGPWGSTGLWHYRYINFGFVFLQDMIDRTLINILTNKTVPEPGVYVQQFPYPCYIKDRFINGLGNSMPLFMTLAWIYTIAMIVKSIVYEKQLRLKEVMKVMGLTNTVHWTAWFVTSFVTMLITIVSLAVLLKLGDILIYSDITVVIFVLLIFACASIALAFLISVFFSNANVSAACGGIIYFTTYLAYPLTLWFEEQMNFSEKGAASLFSTTAFGLSFKYISRWEEQGIGAQWSNLFDNPMVSDTFSVGWTIIFMVLDTIIYLILMWYFEHVLPGEYGIPKPWYFLFTSTYWSEKCRKAKIGASAEQYTYNSYYQHSNDATTPEEPNSEELQPRNSVSKKFEKEPDMKVGVHIQNLVKVYRRGNKKALDGLNLKMFEGQVTALLGHNGAGKSTTMSVLTGLFPPTAGTAVVYGHDIRTDIEGVRKSLGLCPQHNVLFDNLTVEEHMWFYGRLKGMQKMEVEKEIERFLVDVGLPEKRNELSCNLSGGMKRKLSVAMAFIADSKTIILDEPTSGVDPYSRRSIWDLILKHKEGRTILLSTHYMDEADLLGDRISIISNGQLQCSGTSMFLKRHFSKGYFLTVTKESESAATFDVQEITKFIASFVPGAKLNENFGTELSFVLPSAARLTGEFANLFQNLEESMKSLGIESYGISDTTLEEVFLKACDADIDYTDDDTVSLTGPAQSRRHLYDDTTSLNSVNSQTDLIRTSDIVPTIDNVCEQTLSWGPLLWFQQYKALLIKRFHHARRNIRAFISQTLLPAIFVVLAMIVSNISPPQNGLPMLNLTTAMFEKPNYVVIENRDVNEFSEKLMKAYVRAPGLGFDCIKPAKCSAKNVLPFFHNGAQTKMTLLNCSCSTGKQKCPKNAGGPKPPYKLVSTGDTVQDVTGRDISDYLLKTTDDYVRKRYGGVTFGETAFNLPDLNVTFFNTSNLNLASNFGVRRNVKVWYNPKAYHALPTFINVMNNAILRANLDPKLDPTEYGIAASNHPMNFTAEQFDEVTMKYGIVTLFVAIFVILAMAFVPASFVVYLVEDRVSKSKHLQLVSGFNPVVYWIANFSWDLINYLIPAFCCMVIFFIFNQKAYVSSENIGPTLILLFLYGWSMTPLMYPSSFFFDVPSTAYIVLIAVNLFVGIIGTLSTFILEYIGDGDPELKDINTVLKQVFLVFPNYCLGRGLMDLATNKVRNEIQSDPRFAILGGSSRFTHPFEWEIVGRNVFAMFICGILYMIITILCQYRFFVKPWVSKVNENPKENEEEDVAKEKLRISDETLDSEELVLRTDNLTKLYKTFFTKRKTLAVDRLNFGMQKGECFGLLGVNGAGKTSTFKMLTGDTAITAGDAYVNGHSVRTDMNSARKCMGYCPQFDALDEMLTGKELLVYYAQVRGMSRKDSDKMSDWAIETLGLTPYKDKICGDYSGGNKRKLSTAIALIGSPPLIFLDEPTTGMDPGARRFLWNVVTGLLKSGKSVVLTSHSMEECETLCTRLAIMVNGEFQCFGSPQHLRSKFGTGYTIIIRSRPAHVSSVQDFVAANFVEGKLKDRHHYMLEYQIPTTQLSLSQVFQKLEMLRKTNTIEDYSVTQTTLDQIFVNFARNQVEAVQVEDEEQPPGYISMENWIPSQGVVNV